MGYGNAVLPFASIDAAAFRGAGAATHTLAPMLLALRPFLPEPLVSRESYARLLGATEGMPGRLTDLLYLEARLHDDPAIDLVLRVADEARDLVTTGAYATAAEPEGEPARGGRERLAALSATWDNPRSPLSSALHHIWLEFDLDAATIGHGLTPGVFACFGELRPESYSAAEWQVLSHAALQPLLGAEPGPELSARLADCFAALPVEAYVPYVGVMLGRPEHSVRLCLTGISLDALPAYLTRIGWSGALDVLPTLCGRLIAAQPAGPLHGAMIAHLDINATGVWRLGLEFACRRPPQVRGTLQETAMLEELVRAGLALPGKVDALCAWPGARAWRNPATGGDRIVSRRVNHVKLVIRPDGAMEAKAYLAAQHFARDVASPVAAGLRALTPHAKENVQC